MDAYGNAMVKVRWAIEDGKINNVTELEKWVAHYPELLTSTEKRAIVEMGSDILAAAYTQS